MPTRFDTPSNRANFNGCTMPPAWGYQHQPQFLKWRTWAQPARPAHSLVSISNDNFRFAVSSCYPNVSTMLLLR
ncbi:hypothetical protein TNCV_835201 [Trichonephila clavipes]|nr:hypothetical protein TNCV_835201 [Trichonephila clavipes]